MIGAEAGGIGGVGKALAAGKRDLLVEKRLAVLVPWRHQ
jgi:hypothetical protein